MTRKYTFNRVIDACVRIVFTLLLLFTTTITFSQQMSEGNTYIFSGGEMTFFGTHNFTNGGSGALPGIIGTFRGTQPGVLNFASTANSYSGASDAAFVDGYVRKYGNGSFIFPVGDNNRYAPFAAAANATMGAYYYANPSTAITSNLAGGNYGALPTGGPFSTSSIGTMVDKVTPIEYWDIDGANATKLSLTWDLTSDIATLTAGNLTKLSIVGWDGSQWVVIPSTVDNTSILDGASTLSDGSITTNAAIIPNTYVAYTLASLTEPLPVKLISFNVKREGSVVSLEWYTTEEINSHFFDVEHSTDGKTWISIARILTQQNATSQSKYTYTHPTPSMGQNIYRLKMVDLDDTYAYSYLRSLVLDISETQALYPNPTVTSFTIPNYQLFKSLEITDIKGRIVQKVQKLNFGEINVQNLPHGFYNVRIIDLQGKSSNHKLLIGF